LYGPLTARGYRAWLHRVGVAYVVLPRAPLDYSASREAKLLRSGRSGLALAYRFAGGTIYRVRSPAAIVSGGRARILAVRADAIVLDVAARGSYRLALRPSRYWHASRGCVTASGRSILLHVPSAGRVKLSIDLDAESALGALIGAR